VYLLSLLDCGLRFQWIRGADLTALPGFEEPTGLFGPFSESRLLRSSAFVPKVGVWTSACGGRTPRPAKASVQPLEKHHGFLGGCPSAALGCY